ncbi:AAA domain-containing protein [Pseudorhodobacter antarcticus]|uniref:AAA domain-containing protein n=1 Tax=Pseudorhodobacter antarcticus TaxID=1077947 RepID=A0A1H8HNR8_9RHOB|nr:AAA family ATPase [Pseudorhodobacter antarcticus]SEN57733.1 AAA domain-containing protein [Pseudorhodobacter antarcticus]
MNISQPTAFIPKVTDRATRIASQFVPLAAIKPVLGSNYLVKGLLDRGGFSVIYGESNVGKTFLALDLALHVAADTAWHQSRVCGGAVIYVAGEGGAGIKNRIAAIGLKVPELAARAEGRFTLLPTNLDLCTGDDAAALIAALSQTDVAPALIVIDTLARSMGAGDENTAKDMGLLVQSVDAIREATGAHVAIIHHSGKDAAKGARGSGSLRAAVDTEIELTRNRDTIIATTKKQRDMICGAKFAYSLSSVDLGTDGDGDPITSAVVVRADMPLNAAQPLKRQALIAMQALGDALAAHGEVKHGEDFPPNRQCVSLDHWRKACDRHQLTNGGSDSALRQAFGRAWKSLQDGGLVRVLDGFAWMCAGE